MATHQWRVVAELAAAQHGVVTRAQAAERGLDRARLRAVFSRGLVEQIQPNVLRLVGAPRTWHQDLMAACLTCGGTASHRSARALARLDGPLGVAPIELTVARRVVRPVAGAIVHRVEELPRCDVTVVDGIPVTNIARTLCDLGAVVSSDEVEQALDDALRRGASPRWIEQTLARLERPGPSGTGTLRRVLQLPDRQGVVAGSWRERVTARLLAHPELTPMALQHEIRTADGRHIATVDMAVLDARVGVEFHSDQWHYGPRRGRKDRRRDLAAGRVGWELHYLDRSDHATPADALAAILDIVRLRRALFSGRTGA
jgi:hypothetical protein